MDWNITNKVTRNRLMSNENLQTNDILDDTTDEEIQKKSKKRGKFKSKFSLRNPAMKFTLYTDRKGIVDTDPHLPNITPKYISEATDPNNHNTFGTNLKGAHDIRRSLGRKKSLQKFNNNPSSFDYSPNYINIKKYENVDHTYKKKKYKLMKLLKSYECRSDYQIVDI